MFQWNRTDVNLENINPRTHLQAGFEWGFPSYLNLIENDKRPLSAPLLIKIAGLFGLDFQAFSEDDQARLLSDAMEVLGDPLFDEHELTQQDVRDFARFNPGVTQALLTLYRSYIKGREANETLASRIEDAGVEGLSQLQSPEEEVTDFLERQKNYFPALEQAAEALSRKAELEPSDRYYRMARFLEKEHGITIDMVPVESDTAVLRSYNPDRRVLRLAQLLPPRSLHFQLAVQIGLLTYDDEIQRIVGEASFSSPAALTRQPVTCWRGSPRTRWGPPTSRCPRVRVPRPRRAAAGA